jgi:hypothetical protein
LCCHIGCKKDSANPEEEQKKGVLVLEDEGTQDSLMMILKDAGIEAESAGPYWEYDGDNIDRFKLIIFLNGVEWTEVMSTEVQQKIRTYVINGGVLFSTEWISWSGATNQVLNDMLPVVYNGWWSTGVEQYTKMADHFISQSLPVTFDVPPHWSYSAIKLDTTASKNATLIFQGSLSGAAVVLGDFGMGKVIHWNMGGQYNGNNIWTADVRQLLINIVNYGLNISKAGGE